jgi:hypothetical protein
MGARHLLCGSHSFELDIRLHDPHRFLNPDNGVFDRGGVAITEGTLNHVGTATLGRKCACQSRRSGWGLDGPSDRDASLFDQIDAPILRLAVLGIVASNWLVLTETHGTQARSCDPFAGNRGNHSLGARQRPDGARSLSRSTSRRYCRS